MASTPADSYDRDSYAPLMLRPTTHTTAHLQHDAFSPSSMEEGESVPSDHHSGQEGNDRSLGPMKNAVAKPELPPQVISHEGNDSTAGHNSPNAHSEYHPPIIVDNMDVGRPSHSDHSPSQPRRDSGLNMPESESERPDQAADGTMSRMQGSSSRSVGERCTDASHEERVNEMAKLLATFASQIQAATVPVLQSVDAKRISCSLKLFSIAQQEPTIMAHATRDSETLDAKLEQHLQARELLCQTMAEKMLTVTPMQPAAPLASGEENGAKTLENLRASIRDLTRQEAESRKMIQHLQTLAAKNITDRNTAATSSTTVDKVGLPSTVPSQADFKTILLEVGQFKNNYDRVRNHVLDLGIKTDQSRAQISSVLGITKNLHITLDRVQTRHGNMEKRLSKVETRTAGSEPLADRVHGLVEKAHELPKLRLEFGKLRQEVRSLSATLKESSVKQADTSMEPASTTQKDTKADSEFFETVKEHSETMERFQALLSKVDTDLQQFDDEVEKFSFRLDGIEAKSRATQAQVEGIESKSENFSDGLNELRTEQEDRDRLVVEEIELAKKLATEQLGTLRGEIKGSLADEIKKHLRTLEQPRSTEKSGQPTISTTTSSGPPRPPLGRRLTPVPAQSAPQQTIHTTHPPSQTIRRQAMYPAHHHIPVSVHTPTHAPGPVATPTSSSMPVQQLPVQQLPVQQLPVQQYGQHGLVSPSLSPLMSYNAGQANSTASSGLISEIPLLRRYAIDTAYQMNTISDRMQILTGRLDTILPGALTKQVIQQWRSMNPQLVNIDRAMDDLQQRCKAMEKSQEEITPALTEKMEKVMKHQEAMDVEIKELSDTVTSVYENTSEELGKLGWMVDRLNATARTESAPKSTAPSLITRALPASASADAASSTIVSAPKNEPSVAESEPKIDLTSPTSETPLGTRRFFRKPVKTAKRRGHPFASDSDPFIISSDSDDSDFGDVVTPRRKRARTSRQK